MREEEAEQSTENKKQTNKKTVIETINKGLIMRHCWNLILTLLKGTQRRTAVNYLGNMFHGWSMESIKCQEIQALFCR